jgi:hypothetical protein
MDMMQEDLPSSQLHNEYWIKRSDVSVSIICLLEKPKEQGGEVEKIKAV